MICLLRKHDIISVPLYAEGIYHRSQSDIISKRYHPFRKERISLKKVSFVGRQKRLFFWSRVRESNPPSRLGKPLYYRYTNPASRRIVAQVNGKFNRFLSKLFSIPVNCILQADDFPFCPCGKLQNWQKNCFSKKMWLNFHCRCGRIYKYHYGRIAPIWTSPKR